MGFQGVTYMNRTGIYGVSWLPTWEEQMYIGFQVVKCMSRTGVYGVSWYLHE